MAILRWRFAADRCPSGSHLEPANNVSCSISDQRESADRFLFFLLRRIFVLVFRGSQGRSPPPVCRRARSHRFTRFTHEFLRRAKLVLQLPYPSDRQSPLRSASGGLPESKWRRVSSH